MRIDSSFRPAWWLPGPHLQTILPGLLRRRPRPRVERRRIELSDGDFVDLSCGGERGARVLIIHGLEGGLDSHYAGTLFERIVAAGLRPVFMHLRGASHAPNRLARSYHAGASDDLSEVLAALADDPDGPPEAAVGFSLGGNILLKYLGERPEPMVRRAVAVSVPFVLRDAMLRLEVGLSRVYRRYLLARLKAAYRRKMNLGLAPPEDLDAIRGLDDFDDRITAPLNGFAGVFDYYQRASCRQFLPSIQTPTLIIQAADDPFMFPATVPQAHELGPGVTLELARRGGHVGFVAGRWPWRPHWWLETRIVDFLTEGGTQRR